MGLELAHGGHLTHGMKINVSGPAVRHRAYQVDRETSLIDMDEVERLAHERRPKMILAGWSAYPRQLDFARFREIADAVGAYLMVDMAHFAGPRRRRPASVAGAARRRGHDHDPQDDRRRARRDDPVQRGARQEDQLGGVPRAAGRPAGARDRRQGGGAEDRRVGGLPRAPGSGRWTGARAVADRAAGRGRRRERAHRGNRRAPGAVRPARVRPRRPAGRGPTARVGITVNRNAVPFDPRPPAVSSGLRIGTPALATRGLQRRRLRRGRQDHRRGAAAGGTSRPRASELAERAGAIAERYPLYAGLRAPAAV